RMREAASDPALMATDLAEKLVELGVPFRDAHHRVGAFVKYCREHQMALDEATLAQMQETIPEATEEFLTLFSPENSVAKRDIFGATGFRQVASQIEFWQKNLQ
ncbi:MAG: argininosuccinate lyase, partial [Lentisphaeria bacterium]|nr:argininosuccinate lyase [Lentisphaeria bacterium]